MRHAADSVNATDVHHPARLSVVADVAGVQDGNISLGHTGTNGRSRRAVALAPRMAAAPQGARSKESFPVCEQIRSSGSPRSAPCALSRRETRMTVRVQAASLISRSLRQASCASARTRAAGPAERRVQQHAEHQSFTNQNSSRATPPLVPFPPATGWHVGRPRLLPCKAAPRRRATADASLCVWGGVSSLLPMQRVYRFSCVDQSQTASRQPGFQSSANSSFDHLLEHGVGSDLLPPSAASLIIWEPQSTRMVFALESSEKNRRNRVRTLRRAPVPCWPKGNALGCNRRADRSQRLSNSTGSTHEH